MLASIRELFSLLTPRQRRKWVLLQFLVVLKGGVELISVGGIYPFMSVASDPQQLTGDGLLAQVYRLSPATTHGQFLVFLAIAFTGIMVVSAAFKILTKWQIVVFSKRVGVDMSNRLFQHYLYQPWLFHSAGSSSALIKQINTEVNRVTQQIVLPLLIMNTEIFMVVLMLVGLLVLNPWVVLVGAAMYVLMYGMIYRLVRRRLVRNGKVVSQYNQVRFKLLVESFAGIKDVLLLGRQPNFSRQFDDASCRLEEAQKSTTLIGAIPQRLVEVFTVSSVLVLIIVFMTVADGGLEAVLPLLSVYALAFNKLKPSTNKIYRSISKFKANQNAIISLKQDLEDSYQRALEIEQQRRHIESSTVALPVLQAIELRGVTFTYPGKSEPALVDCDLRIPRHSVVGLVGSSGAGKSTAIDIILGLLPPQQGQLLVDGVPISDENRRAWQNGLGFVPQAIFLADDSIRRNIAFGLADEAIDDERVRRAAEMAHLREFIESLPEGFETRVGERGVQLSGGQRQRIGIARALYDDADTLILDEATSALDGITEKLIMDAIHDFSGKKTIVLIAHRLSTVKQCDTIFLMEDGRVADQGSYAELEARSEVFQRMAQHSS